MLFDCVWVNTGLVFNWICNRETKGVYVNWWWYQSWTIFLYYACWSFLIGENISIWMLPFRFESSCARDGGIWWIILHRGGSYLVVLSSGCGDFVFTTSHHATRASSWPYMDFWTLKSFVTSVPRWSYAPIWEMGVSMALYGSLHPSLSFWGAYKTTLPTTLVWWYGRHHNLVDRCEISISQRTMDLFTYMFFFLHQCQDSTENDYI